MITTDNQNNIKHIIGITAAKGGVGKSTITCLLANEYSRLGHSVAILDANFNSASITSYFGLQAPLISQHGMYTPLQSETGIKILPLNKLVDDGKQAFIWKEEKAGEVVNEILHKTHWGNLDYLFIDLPTTPMEGTIAILQSIPISGLIFVTQPQAVAAQLTRKAIQLTKHLGMPLIGIVENMSAYQADQEQSSTPIWGPSHTDDIGETILAHIPFLTENCLLCDSGKVEDILLPESIQLYEAVDNLLPLLEKKNTISRKPAELILPFDNTPAESTDPYSVTVNQLIQKKENLGTLDHPDGEGHFMGKCGDRMQIDIQLNADKISAAKFQSDGCGVTLACGSMITQMTLNKTITEAQQIRPDELVNALDGLPDDHLHCADLAVMTLREALIDALEGHKTIKK